MLDIGRRLWWRGLNPIQLAYKFEVTTQIGRMTTAFISISSAVNRLVAARSVAQTSPFYFLRWMINDIMRTKGWPGWVQVSGEHARRSLSTVGGTHSGQSTPHYCPPLIHLHSPSPRNGVRSQQQVWNRVMNWTWTCVSPYCDLPD